MQLKNASTGEMKTSLPPQVIKMVKALNELGDGEYLTLTQLAIQVGCHRSSAAQAACMPPLSNMRIKDKQTSIFWYVSEKTKKAIDAEENQ